MILTSIAWAVSSLYYFEFADWRPYATAGISAAVIYPLIGAVVSGLNPSREETRNVFLKRGM